MRQHCKKEVDKIIFSGDNYFALNNLSMPKMMSCIPQLLKIYLKPFKQSNAFKSRVLWWFGEQWQTIENCFWDSLIKMSKSMLSFINRTYWQNIYCYKLTDYILKRTVYFNKTLTFKQNQYMIGVMSIVPN